LQAKRVDSPERNDPADRKTTSTTMSATQFWWRELRVPLMLFLLLAPIFATTMADIAIARALFFDASSSNWIGADSWWTNEFLHTGGRWAVRGVVALTLIFLIAASVDGRLRPWQRPAAYFLVAMVVTIGIVGLLKTLTNIDCPSDLQEFGGAFPYMHLFADRPGALRHARCFPAAHASSGYALLALYFVFWERHRALARFGLGLGMTLGLVFGLAQQSRGAHFVSHDLWSAFLAWALSLTLYAFAFKAQLWNKHEASAAAGRLRGEWITDVRRRPGAVAGAAGRRRAGRPAVAGTHLHLQHADPPCRSAGDG
jgi:membrane-associated PAP2 superfamily phosphatase